MTTISKNDSKVRFNLEYSINQQLMEVSAVQIKESGSALPGLVRRALNPGAAKGKEEDPSSSRAAPKPALQIFAFKTGEGPLIYVLEQSLTEAKKTMAKEGYELGQSKGEIFLSEILEDIEDRVLEEKEKNGLLVKAHGYLESQLIQSRNAKNGVKDQKMQARLDAEERSLQGSIQYLESLSQKGLAEIKASPFVDTLMRVIAFKETHAIWQK